MVDESAVLQQRRTPKKAEVRKCFRSTICEVRYENTMGGTKHGSVGS